MNWLQRLWVWLTDVPTIEPDPAERHSITISPYFNVADETPEAAAMPAAPEPAVPYSVRVDEPTEEQKSTRASPTVTLSIPPDIIADGPHPDPGARKTPLKPRKRRTRKHK